MLDIVDREQAERLFRALDKDTALYAQTVMGHIVKEIPPFHNDAYRIIDAGYKYSAFVWARGLAKSTISHTIQATKDLCHAKEPYIVLVSETIDQASADMISIQDEIANNDIIHQLYGNLKGDIWNVQSMEATNGCYINCRGYTSRIRGLKWKNWRPTKIILDDFESEQNSSTQDQRDEVKQWISARVEPALEVTSAKIQYWGTIVHPDSYLASIKDNSFFKHPYGAYMEVPIEKDGVSAWPSRYPMEWINEERRKYEERRRLGLFLQEYYNIPSLTGKPRFDTSKITELDGEFRRDGVTTYIKAPNGNKTPINVFIGVDPASSLSDTADNTVITVIGVFPINKDKIKKYIILDILADRLTPTQQRDELFKLVQGYAPKLVTIETQGYQGALEDMCRERMRPSGLYFPIKSFKSGKSKATKWLLGLEPIINAGDIYRLAGLKNWELLQTELVSYNEDSRQHDDTIDGLFLALQDAYGPPNYNVDDMIRKLSDKTFDKQKPRPSSWFTN